MYSADYRKLVDALMMDKWRIEFSKVNKSILGTINYVSFAYGRNNRYTIEVNISTYETTMWHLDADGHNLVLTSHIDDKLKELGRYLIINHLSEIAKAKTNKD